MEMRPFPLSSSRAKPRDLRFCPSEKRFRLQFSAREHGRLRFAVSHISRKTREIWGTLDLLLGESQTGAVYFALNLT